MLRFRCLAWIAASSLWMSHAGLVTAQDSPVLLLPEVAILTDAPGEVQVARASVDGAALAIGWCQSPTIPGGVQVFSAETLAPQSPRLKLGKANCSDAAFSPDGRYLAVVTSDSRLLIWDTRSWQLAGRGSQPSWDWQVIAHPRLPECVTVGGHAEIRRWRLPDGELIGEFRSPFKRIVSAALTSDGKRVVFIGRSGSVFQVQVRSYPGFQLLSEFSSGEERGGLSRIDVSAGDNSFAFAKSDGTVWTGPLDGKSGIRTVSTRLGRTQDVSFLGDRYVWLHGWGRPVGVVDVTDGTWALTDAAAEGGKGMVCLPSTRRLIVGLAGDDTGRAASVFGLPSDDRLSDVLGGQHGSAGDTASKSHPARAGTASAGTGAAGGASRSTSDSSGKTPTGVADRRDVPSAEKVTQAESELMELLGIDARSERERFLATRLLKLADEEQDPVITFAMLNLAAEISVQAFDPLQAQRALDQLSAGYKIDPLRLAGRLLYAVRSRPMASDERRRMATWAERLGDAALTEEEIAYASAFYEIAISWSSRERANLRRRREKAEQVDTLLPAYRRAAPARERLQSDPANPAANGRWGAYLCFVRGKWREGLPALALSDDDRLRELAEADLAVGNDPQEMLKVAAEWRDYAEAHEESAAGDGALIAAHYWYSRAAERLQGVEKLRASANAAKISLPAGSSTRNWPLVKQ